MQENTNINTSYTVNESNSLKDLILNIRDWIHYFLSKKYIIILFGLLGGGLGFTYALLKKPVYIASTSFVLETGGNKGALASYSGIASAFGIDLGCGGGGLFEGENILELYRSRTMISRTLLTEGNFDGKKQLLIDRYIDKHGLRKKWKEKPELKGIRFASYNKYSNTRQQLLHDSIISSIVKEINKNYLEVGKIDKKLNIIKITVTSNDELFAKNFNEKLVENVNRFYLETKTKKSLENVQILQAKVDSVRNILTGAVHRAVAVADATPNQNLTRMTQRVAPIQNATISAEVNKQVLSTLLQNLELGKITLQKETPLIQIVDAPVLPLQKKGVSKLLMLILGGFLAGLLSVIYLMVRRIITSALR
ncbi:lipopolysaccharide biosynthesis protein [Niabella digestorum]|uniref:Lipopolysaccharide biosynthesis protein n=1 Tax=Niabella digestorum TaxID=3117701 RepID=A0ABU7RFI4_9BACT